MKQIICEPGQKLSVEVRGEGPEIVFLHGMWMSSEVFESQVRYFSNKYTVATIDFRGHGKSPCTRSGHTVPCYAADVAMTLKNIGITSAIFVGHSLGALVGLHLGAVDATKPLVRHLVCVAQSPTDFAYQDWPFGSIDINLLATACDRLQSDRFNFLNSVSELLLGDTESHIAQNVLNMMRNVDPAIAATLFVNQTLYDARSLLENYKNGIDWIFGGRDSIASPSIAGYLHRSFPRSTTAVIESSYHCPHIETPNEFNSTLEGILTRFG